MRNSVVPLVAMAALAGCAQQPPPGPQAAPPAAAAAGAVAAGPSGRATTCRVGGFSWQRRDAQLSPTMTLSNDGFCNAGYRLQGSSSGTMTVVTQPQHGRLVTSDSGLNPYLRYYPAQGYQGPDSFAITAGTGGRVSANFAVEVTNP